ncbi:flavin monoamine oxidase family protein [Streptomyces sp. NPDC001816]|uniref:flavin monoamine oxidase family protein n=1 Tax=Streptomyces sp. NPDC001816 TaxID=3364612 RepID=UPI003687BF03
MRADVIVVGAGASGLACARRLNREGLTVVVHEARDRVGGRIHTFHPTDGGPPLELGAQVVHGAHNPVHALVGADRMITMSRRFTARVVEDGAHQDMGVLSHGRRPPWLLETGLHRDPGQEDRSVGAWLRARGSAHPEGRAAQEWFRQNWAAEPDELSARGVSRAHRGDTGVGEGEFTVRGGFDRLPLLLAQDLRISLGDPVQEIRCLPGRVEATTVRGTTSACAAVITVPPPVVAQGRLRLAGPDPAVLDAKIAAAGRMPLGDGYCAVVTLTRRAPDTAVTFDVDGRGGFVRCSAGRPEVLFVAKAKAADALRATVRSAPALSALLETVMPWTAGARVADVTAADWGRDPWTAGAFTAPRTGYEDAVRQWAAPVDDTLFFAGEATVTGSRLPWVQGALASGERAAEELLKVLANR